MEASRASLAPGGQRPIHLHPVAPLAERALLPGDPARALLLAGLLTERPIMFNHHRGLWGYTGQAADGHSLTIQSTGMGGPSAAIVIGELSDLGVQTMIRVGTCGALSPELSLGDLLVVMEALAFDGTARALADGRPLQPDASLLSALSAGAPPGALQGRVASTDFFYDSPEGEQERWVQAGAAAVDMETAILFELARRRSIRAASLLLVSDLLLPERVRIDEEALLEGERRLGEAAMEALRGA